MRALAYALAAAGLAIAGSSTVAALGDRGPVISAYATASPGLAIISSLAAASLFAAAVLLVAEGAPARLALATFFLGAAWSADLWAGWSGAPTLVRNAGMLLVPTLAPAALLLVASLLDRPMLARPSVAIAMAAMAVAVVVWLVRDPFLDRYCWRDCLAHSLAPFPDAELARTLTNVSLTVGSACGAAVAALCGVDLFRRRSRWADFAGVAAGCALLASDVALRLEPSGRPDRSLFAGLFVVQGLALVILAGALGRLALRPRLVRHAISRLASAGDGFAAALAGALGGPELRVGYPVAGGGLVIDAEGRPTTFEAAPVRIVRGSEVIALVGGATGAPDAAALEAALGPAARLALANERLRANQLFRLDELTELRRRIVATGDATRRRLERDLHDGAQQRLLALAIDLRVAIRHAEDAGRPDVVNRLVLAVERVAEATDELRSVAHGIFPATLASAGLVAALETLADTRPLVLSIGPESRRRYPTELETAAYAFVLDATAGTRKPVRVRVGERAIGLVLTIDEAPQSGAALGAEERLGAAGGTVTRTDGQIQAVLPLPPAC